MFPAASPAAPEMLVFLAMTRNYDEGIEFVSCGNGKVLSCPTVGANVPVKNSKSGGADLELQEHKVKLGFHKNDEGKSRVVLSMICLRPWGSYLYKRIDMFESISNMRFYLKV